MEKQQTSSADFGDTANKKRLLLILDHAPDYRELFLRELGKHFNLHVLAQPCAPDYLTPPGSRSGYAYSEYQCWRILGFRLHSGLADIVKDSRWDAICSNFNLRQPSRIWSLLRNSELRRRWYWRGRIVGRSDKHIFARILKRRFLRRAAGCLVYNEVDAHFVRRTYHPNTRSFNNTEVATEEFRTSQFSRSSVLKLLFVGRNQPRKKLGRLWDLAMRNPNVAVRIIGPNSNLISPASQSPPSRARIDFYDRIIGEDLNAHFDWADLVISPGHVGLLVMNAARHGKPILIDSGSQHAPENQLALAANQIYVDCSQPDTLDATLDDLTRNYEQLKRLGQKLQDVAKADYTVENMARVHAKMINNEAKATGS